MLKRLLPVLLLLVSVLVGTSPNALAQPAPFCAANQTPAFRFGFADLKTLLGDAMGDPAECEHVSPDNGDTLQRTSTGLAVYRKSANTPTFTDGYAHWALTAEGLVSWVGPGANAPVAPTPPAAVADAVASRNQSGWATVAQVLGPETLLVENDAGATFRVWHIGVVGPSSDQGDWRDRATNAHASLLPAGTRVWLERVPDLAQQNQTLLLRHVFRADRMDRPLGADLVRSGFVWVYPHGSHAYRELYADLQAQAVGEGAGAWGETHSSAVFHPRGTSHGGLPIDPAVAPSLTALDASEMGHAILAEVNLFPVEVGVSPQADGVIGSFMPRYYSVQLTPELLDSDPQAIAGVLVHELVHVKQMIARVVENRRVTCYDAEREAFEASAVYWQTLFGPQGKLPAADSLERELNGTLRQYRAGQLDTRVHEDYEAVCGAA